MSILCLLAQEYTWLKNIVSPYGSNHLGFYGWLSKDHKGKKLGNTRRTKA